MSSTAKRSSSMRVLAPLIERFRESQGGVRAHHHGACGRIRGRSARPGVAATITPQHLLHNRNAIFSGGIRPHFYCLPILKREQRSPSAAWRRDRRQSAVLPRHRQRAARAVDQGECLRLRRHVHRTRGDRVVRRGLRISRPTRPSGVLRQPFRRGFLRTAAPPGDHYVDQGALGAPRNLRFRRRHAWCPIAAAKRSHGGLPATARA